MTGILQIAPFFQVTDFPGNPSPFFMFRACADAPRDTALLPVPLRPAHDSLPQCEDSGQRLAGTCATSCPCLPLCHGIRVFPLPASGHDAFLPDTLPAASFHAGMPLHQA